MQAKRELAMMTVRTIAPVAIALVAPCFMLASVAHAQPAWPDCPNNYPGGIAPRVAGAADGELTDLCYHGFAVGFSRSHAGPLSSSQFLTRARMNAAAAPVPADAAVAPLHAEMRVPESLRVSPSSYAGSTYMAGQLSPAADMADLPAKSDSMSITNTVPQTAQLHALWTKLEHTARVLAAQYDVIYVVSGPIYQPNSTQPAAGNLHVPDGVYKAVYNPEANWAGAYVCSNTTQPSCGVVSLSALQAMTGVDVFPALSAAVKAAVPPLPAPG